MAIKDAWFQSARQIGPAVAPGMSELQADQQALLRSANLLVLFDQSVAQLRKSSARVVCNDQLIRIGAAFVTYRDGLATPNELGAALSEAPPPAHSVFAGPSVRRAVPTFHWVDGDTVGDCDLAAPHRLQQGRLCPKQQFV